MYIETEGFSQHTLKKSKTFMISIPGPVGILLCFTTVRAQCHHLRETWVKHLSADLPCLRKYGENTVKEAGETESYKFLHSKCDPL